MGESGSLVVGHEEYVDYHDWRTRCVADGRGRGGGRGGGGNGKGCVSKRIGRKSAWFARTPGRERGSEVNGDKAGDREGLILTK